MRPEDFDIELDRRIELIRTSLKVKAKEYIRNNNALHNFEEGSQISGQTPTRVLDGFLLKHIISYRDMLNDIDKEVIPGGETVSEKFGDIINYFIIQEIQIKNMIQKDIHEK